MRKQDKQANLNVADASASSSASSSPSAAVVFFLVVAWLEGAGVLLRRQAPVLAQVIESSLAFQRDARTLAALSQQE